MKCWLIVLSMFAMLLVGCTVDETELAKIPDINDNPEAFVCTTDADCVMQSTSCFGCDCPIAINKDYFRPLNCEHKPDQGYCDLYCYPSTPKCVNNSCVAVRTNNSELN